MGKQILSALDVLIVIVFLAVSSVITLTSVNIITGDTKTFHKDKGTADSFSAVQSTDAEAMQLYDYKNTLASIQYVLFTFDNNSTIDAIEFCFPTLDKEVRVYASEVESVNRLMLYISSLIAGLGGEAGTLYPEDSPSGWTGDTLDLIDDIASLEAYHPVIGYYTENHKLICTITFK